MIAGLALWLGHPFFFSVPIIAYYYIKKNLSEKVAILVFPALWTAFEWLHSLGDLSFPWQAIGYSQLSILPIAQLAEIGGVWLLSFWIVLVNIIIYTLLFLVRERKIQLYVVTFLTFCFVSMFIWGGMQLSQWHEVIKNSTRKLPVGIIQPNINPWSKWSGDAFANVEKHLYIQDSLKKIHPDIALFVWSETAILDRILLPDGNYTRNVIDKKLSEQNVQLLTGFVDTRYFREKKLAPPLSTKIPETPFWVATYTAACVLPVQVPDTVQIHRKGRLTPFGEGFPFAEHIEFATEWLRWGVGISGWAKGRTTIPLQVKMTDGSSTTIAPIICIESIYPEWVRSFVNNSAEILAVITNDAWYDGTPGPEQHYAIAAMRAIEHRRFMIRCANSGVSGIIKPDGTSSVKLENRRQGGIYGNVIPLTEKTIYTRYGDWIAYLSLAIAFLGIASARFARRRK
jgi:apolipoprotein N-acyltransferase